MINNFFKNKTLPFSLLYFLFISSISNYSIVFIIIKTFSFFIIFFYWNEFKKELGSVCFIRFIKFTIIIIACFLLTINHSANPQFGFTKLFIMIISYIPTIILTFLVIKSANKLEFFIHLIIILASIGCILSILLSPFEYERVYAFSFFRWSHVVFGRFIGLALLFNLYLILNQKKRNLLFNISLQIIIFGLLFSGARGAVFVTLICSLLIIVFSKSILTSKMKVIAQLLFVLIVFYSFGPDSIQKRLVNSGEIILGQGEIDGSLNSRILAFEISIERWQQNPITGLGLGGFNTFYKTDLPQKIIYPHNILLEILIELGIVGIILFFLFFFSLFMKIWKIDYAFSVFLLYALGLAMFSKDLASNPMLFAFIATYLLESQPRTDESLKISD